MTKVVLFNRLFSKLKFLATHPYLTSVSKNCKIIFISFNFRKFEGQFMIKMDYSGGTKSTRHPSSHHLSGYNSSNHHSSSQHSSSHLRPSSSMSRRSYSPRSTKYGKQMLQCYFKSC